MHVKHRVILACEADNGRADAYVRDMHCAAKRRPIGHAVLPDCYTDLEYNFGNLWMSAPSQAIDTVHLLLLLLPDLLRRARNASRHSAACTTLVSLDTVASSLNRPSPTLYSQRIRDKCSPPPCDTFPRTSPPSQKYSDQPVHQVNSRSNPSDSQAPAPS